MKKSAVATTRRKPEDFWNDFDAELAMRKKKGIDVSSSQNIV